MAVQGIVLVGEPGSGKSTIGEALLTLARGFRVSFAGPLKDELAFMLAPNLSGVRRTLRRAMDDPATKDKYRPLLQALGSFRRAEDAEYWVRMVLARIRDDTFYVIDDCRYANEADALMRLGFKFVRLESGETTRPLEGAQAEHESERDWPSFRVHLVLSYEKGPAHQAGRIARAFGMLEESNA